MRGVYYIKCKVNNKIYVGSSVWIDKRFEQHLSDLSYGKHSNPGLQADFTKYGRDSFERGILETVTKECTRDSLYDLEDKWMNLYPNKYNRQSAKAHLSKKPINLEGKIKAKKKKNNQPPKTKAEVAHNNLYTGTRKEIKSKLEGKTYKKKNKTKKSYTPEQLVQRKKEREYMKQKALARKEKHIQDKKNRQILLDKVNEHYNKTSKPLIKG